MAVKSTEVIKFMMTGCDGDDHQMIEQDTAVLVVEEMGHTGRCLRTGKYQRTICREETDFLDRSPCASAGGDRHGASSITARPHC